MFSKKSDNSWIMMSSAVVGGFLLGMSYKKYGKDIKHSIQKMTKRSIGYDYDDGYTTSHEPDA